MPPARLALLTLTLLLCAAGLLGGCTRVRTALAVQSDDTVDGELIIASRTPTGPALSLPPSLAGRVGVRPYQADGYQGSQLDFTGLRLDEVNSLVSVAPDARGRFQFALRRVGGALLLTGQVDLTAVPVDGADVQLKVAFPGDVTTSNGRLSSDAVSWVFPAGQVSEFNATVSAPDPAAPSVTRWALLAFAVLAAVSLVVVLLAKAQRNPPARRR